MKNIFFVFLFSLSLAVNLSVIPSNYHLEMSPGESTRRTFTVTNKGNQEIEIRVYLNDWDLVDKEKVFLPKGSTPYTIVDSVAFYPTLLTLLPGESQQVMMNVRSSKNDHSGEYGVLFFEGRPRKEPNSTGVSFGGRIGSILYKEIKDRSFLNYTVSNVVSSLVGNKVYYRYTLSNEGNILINPKMTVLAINEKNEVIGQDQSLDTSVLPNKARIFSNHFLLKSKDLISENITFIITLDFGNDNVFMDEIVVK
jgi:hypothetical protein